MSPTVPPDPSERALPMCPFCGATEVELFALFGSQLLTQQYYCRACHTPFERLKEAGDDHSPGPAERTPRRDTR